MPTKAQVTLDIEYDLAPSRYNKIEIEKILAIMCHELEQDLKYTWEDVNVINYNYKINLNPYYGNPNFKKKTTQKNENTGEKEWTHLQELEI